MPTIFEERTFTYTDKTLWPVGPWTTEVDRIQWVDPTTGYDCLLTRNPYCGFLCGYAGIPTSHPLSGVDYGDLYNRSFAVESEITFSRFCAPKGVEEGSDVCHVAYPGRPDKVYWFGFHCGNMRDFEPNKSTNIQFNTDQNDYRDIAFVREHVTKLALALKDWKA